MIAAALIALLTLAISLSVTGLVRSYALGRDLMDHPNDRSSHTVPTPRGGGLAILVAIAAGVAVAWAAGAIPLQMGVTLVTGMGVLGAVGWLDDARGVPPLTRFVIHVLVGGGTVAAVGGFPILHLGDLEITLGYVGSVLATLGVVWAINLFNFMDGIDGIAGSQAVLIFGVAAALLFSRGAVSLALVAAIFASANLGFLVWNWPPAKIFMGDVGSGAVGYLVAALALMADRERSVPVVVFAILGGVFIFDATVTLVRRSVRGKHPAEAHRDHAYQRMTRAWGGHSPVTLAAAVITLLLSGFAAVSVLNPRLLPASGLAAVLVLSGVMLAAERRSPM